MADPRYRIVKVEQQPANHVPTKPFRCWQYLGGNDD
jgi:hypothetical protein